MYVQKSLIVDLSTSNVLEKKVFESFMQNVALINPLQRSRNIHFDLGRGEYTVRNTKISGTYGHSCPRVSLLFRKNVGS